MRSAAELQKPAWRATVPEFGVADALRYRILFRPGAGNYAADREMLMAAIAPGDWTRELERWDLRRREVPPHSAEGV